MKTLKEMRTHHQILFAIFIGLAVIAFWRGVWGLLEVYLFPNNLVLSLWISTLVGLIILAGTHYFRKQSL